MMVTKKTAKQSMKPRLAVSKLIIVQLSKMLTIHMQLTILSSLWGGFIFIYNFLYLLLSKARHLIVE